ncbi:propionyl-coenzyme A carboxylase alpha polypeptide [Rhizobium sp. KAs_5_22]|nr:propionyl-coenzyme A carboxylase alpha polypeptide [Rhizobium sp. KAs_5_22]
MGAPPSGLPAISPSRGEIDFTAAPCLTIVAGSVGAPCQRMISPLEGEMSA